MNRKFAHIVLICSASLIAKAQDDELYDHGLDESKWDNLRESIRYEDQPDGPGREWTYESKSDYESAKKQAGGNGGNGGQGGGSGEGSYGDGGEYRYEEPDSYQNYESPKSRMSGRSFSGLGWLGYVILGAFIILLVVLIIYLFINRPKDGTKVEHVNLEDTAPTEIPLTELQRLLQEALARGDYRGAVRIYFIFILRDLSERNWIRWEKEKTNFQYLREMNGRNEYQDFSQSVSYFEIIWYGKREIDKSTFEQIKPDFTRLLNKLGIE